MAMAPFNSNKFSMFSIKYLHKQTSILQKTYSIFSYEWRRTFLTNLHNTWCIFCEDFILANDRSITWISVSSSAVRTGVHPYWICSNRQAACTQIALKYEVGYALTIWCRSFLLNFSTPCIKNVNNTATKKVSIIK